MRRARAGVKVALAVAAACAAGGAGAGTAVASPTLPLSFEANRGQAAGPADFLARGPGYTVALGRGTARLGLRGGALALRPVGGRLGRPVAADRLPGRVNVFVGARSRWRTGILTFARVAYRRVWRGVDLAFSGREGRLEYDFEVAPHADARRIALRLHGARGLRVAPHGDLRARVGRHPVRVRRPVSYQLGSRGTREAVASRFVLRGRTVRVAVGAYDHARPLVIDPVVSYARLVGGVGNDVPFGVAVDAAGEAYLSGFTSDPSLKTPGALQQKALGDGDAFVSKLNAAGTAVEWSTYLGGSAAEGSATAGAKIALDPAGNAYIAGQTASVSDFPVTTGAAQGSFGGGALDGFVAKLDATGGLAYATFLGGAGTDFAAGVAADATGAAYVLGQAPAGFPTTTGAYQELAGGSTDATVTKLTPTGAKAYATYLGGSAGEVPGGIAVDGTGAASVDGTTTSVNFPTTAGAYQPALAANEDGFVTKLNATGTALTYSTYLGGIYQDNLFDIALGPDGAAYVTGDNVSGGLTGAYPTTAGAFQPDSTGGRDAVVSHLSAAGDALLGSTFLGGALDASAAAIAVDAAGDATVTGNAAGTIPKTATAAQGAPGGGSGTIDAFVEKLSADMSVLRYGTYLGGDGDDAGRDVALDAAGGAYVAGSATGTFPTTTGPTEAAGIADAFLVRYQLAPACVTVAASVPHDTPTGLTLSCSEPGATVTLATASPPAHGTLSAVDQATGKVTYTPTTGYGGTDSFTYQGVSTTGTSSPTTVKLVVGGAPVTTVTPTPSPTPSVSPFPSATATPTPLPPPVQGATFNLVRSEGTVRVRLPGAAGFVDVTQTATIPTGTVVDATHGRVTLFAAGTGDGKGMDLYDGIFVVKQGSDSPLVTLTLIGGDLSGCSKRSPGYKRWAAQQAKYFSSAARAARLPGLVAVIAKKGGKSRKLWGSGKGRFRTVGVGGSATVRGTQWLTRDGCGGTRFRVVHGIVTVRDAATGAKYYLAAGKRVATPFSLKTLRKIEKGGRKVGKLTAKAKRKLRRG